MPIFAIAAQRSAITVMLRHMTSILSVLPTDASALDSSISALKISISVLENSIKSLDSSSAFWERLLPWFTGLVVVGLIVDVFVVRREHDDAKREWARGIVRPPDRPSKRKHVWELIASVAISLGVAGELGVGVKIAAINGQLRSKNSEVRSKSEQLLALVTQEAGDAKQSATDAAGKAAQARTDADAAGSKASAVTKKAEDIDAELVVAQWTLGGRHIFNEVGLENDLAKEFKGNLIVFKSYVQDEEAFVLCKQLVSAARKSQVGVIAQDECADEPPPPHLPITDLHITAQRHQPSKKPSS